MTLPRSDLSKGEMLVSLSDYQAIMGDFKICSSRLGRKYFERYESGDQLKVMCKDVEGEYIPVEILSLELKSLREVTEVEAYHIGNYDVDSHIQDFKGCYDDISSTPIDLDTELTLVWFKRAGGIQSV